MSGGLLSVKGLTCAALSIHLVNYYDLFCHLQLQGNLFNGFCLSVMIIVRAERIFQLVDYQK